MNSTPSTATWPVRHPLLASIGLALIPVIGTAGGSAASQILDLGDAGWFAIAGGAALSAVVGLIIAVVARPTLGAFGFRRPRNLRAAWFMLPALAVVAITLACSGVTVRSPLATLGIATLVIAVALNEELFFRGLVPAVWRSPRTGILVSSALFAILHLASLAGGVSPLYAALQVVFAALFGFAAALVRFHTGSLLLPMLFHAVYDGVSYLGGDALTPVTIAGSAASCVILAVWAVAMWRRVPRTAR